MDFGSIVASFFIGTFSSAVVWWAVAHAMKPNLKFGEQIVERKLLSGDSFYQGVFKNSGKRELVEVEIIARIGIKNFMGASGWAYHSVRTNASLIPSLKSQERRLVRIFDTRDELQFVDHPSKSIREKDVGMLDPQRSSRARRRCHG